MRTCVKISRLMFFCAVAGASSKRFAFLPLERNIRSTWRSRTFWTPE